MKGVSKKILSVLLSVLMVFSSFRGMVHVYAEDETDNSADSSNVTWEVLDDDAVSGLKRKEAGPDQEKEELTGNVRVSIVLSRPSTLDVGYSAEGIAENYAAKNYRNWLKARQDSIAETISAKVLNGKKLDVKANLTLTANIISAVVPADKIDEIKQIAGVLDVFVENRYESAVASVDEYDPNMSNASDMVKSRQVWSSGYTGAGSVVAVIDTGLDIDHELFDAGAYEYAMKENEKDPALNVQNIESVWSQLHASKYVANAETAYVSSKVPFGVNYIDQNANVTHLYDTQEEHGSHVSGIAAGNRYVERNGEYVASLDEVLTQGEAPDAQLLVMKVFGANGGAYDSDYMEAIEDAIVLGADSINLSLGSASHGYTTDSTYQSILNKLAANNAVVAMSAGNSSSHVTNDAILGYLYSDEANFDTVGSPGSFVNSLAVASVNNDGVVGYSFTAAGVKVIYTENLGYNNAPMVTIAGEHEYVYLDNIGDVADFEAVGKEAIEGKIVFCSRGTTSFFEKANNAVEYGAIATIIVNNTDGVINMNLSGYTGTAPAVSILQADGLAIMANSEPVKDADGNVLYYKGTITVGNSVEATNYGSDYYTMSDFSSWGVPEELVLKPEITAPGGDIYSVFGTNQTSAGIAGGTDQYENMSGTSMASPQIAGLAAVAAQYIRENGLEEKTGLTQRQLIQSLFMSTATPLIEADSGHYYSVLKQGAGLVDLAAVVSAHSYVMMDETATEAAKDGKVKVELGDDPDREGHYTATFTLNNLTDKDMKYEFSAELFTQDIFGYYTFNTKGAALADENGNPIVSGYLDYWTVPLNAAVTWYVDGEKVEPKDDHAIDFNGDGNYDLDDALYLLSHVVGNVAAEDVNDYEYADMDGDGDVDSYDAYLALFYDSTVNSTLPANGSITVTADITLPDMEDYDDKGAYVEGYLFAKEAASEEGEAGTEHSIPLLGYYGSWAEPDMTDVGSSLEFEYGMEVRAPHIVSDDDTEMFVVKDATNSVNYRFGGNPYLTDEKYMPERNAMNAEDRLVSAKYTLFRNRGAALIEVLDKDGNYALKNQEGAMQSAFYHVNQAVWKDTVTTTPIGFYKPEAEDGEKYTARVTLASNYFAPDGEADWEMLQKYPGTYMEIPFVIDSEYPSIVSANADKEAGTLTLKVKDNEYIAAVLLLDENNQYLGYFGSDADAEKGAEEEYVFDYPETPHVYFIVADYAMNETKYILNLNPEELDDELAVHVTPKTAAFNLGDTLQLTATITPWGTEDQRVTWTSSDETVLTVDENGVVTGLAIGTATVTATAVADTTKFDTAEITVKPKTLKGVVWDENGDIWFNEFTSDGLPEYDKLSPSINANMTSVVFTKDGTMYGMELEEWNQLGRWFRIDPEADYQLKELGTVEMPYTDLAAAPSLGDNIAVGIYAGYVILVDVTTGGVIGGWDFSTSLPEDTFFAGVAYEASVFNTYYNLPTDWYFFIDTNGTLYEQGFINMNGSYYPFYDFSQAAIGDLEIEALPLWQGFYYDGESIWWTQYDGESNVVNLYQIDFNDDGSVRKNLAGSFAEGVWPVTGLYDFRVVKMQNEIYSKPNVDTMKFDELSPASTEPMELVEFELPKEPETNETEGTLNSVRMTGTERTRIHFKSVIERDSDTSEDGVIYLTSDEQDTNGLYQVEWNPEEMELVKYEGLTKWNEWNKSDLESGKLVFGYIDDEGVGAEEKVAYLEFRTKEEGGLGKVTVTTVEAGEEHPVGETEEYEFGAEKYTLEVEDPENGSVKVEPEKEEYAGGEEVVLTFTPDEGYELDEVLVNGEAVKVNEDGTVTIKVEGDTKVTATFKASEYKFIEGMGQTWTKGSKDGAFFKTDGAFSIFAGLYVDGELLTPDQYEAKEGSTEITLKAEYLETLAEGEHTLTAQYGNGSEPETTFKVAKKSEQPGTGMKGMSSLWYVLAGLGAAAFVVLRKKEETEE